jgi:hypothetical protein
MRKCVSTHDENDEHERQAPNPEPPKTVIGKKNTRGRRGQQQSLPNMDAVEHQGGHVQQESEMGQLEELDQCS